MNVSNRPRHLATRAAFSLVASILMVACSGGSDTAGPPTNTAVEAVTVSPTTATLTLDEERTLAATPSAGGQPLTGRSIAWSSSAGNVASVTQQGAVKAVRAGTARITATSEGKSGFSDITVQNPVPAITSISPTTIAAASAAFTITVDGSGFASDAKVRLNGQERTTTFVSRTRLTATINAADVATTGNASITVSNPAPGGGVSQSASLTISTPAVATVTVTPNTVQLVPGETRQLSAVLKDGNGTEFSGPTVQWTSATPSVATVNANTGAVTAVAPGSALITATSQTKFGNATITVVAGAVIGAAGGQVTASPVSITIPATALSAPTPISIVPEATPPAHPKLVAGSGFTLGPAGTTFAQPVTVRIGWTAAQEPPGSTPSLYAVHRWTGSAWVALANRDVNVGQRYAQGTTTTFSSFALIELTPNPAPVATTVTPNAVDAGSGAASITVSGSGFVASSQILVNDVAIATTFTSATQLTGTLTAAHTATAGTLTIRVRTAAPGGGDSSPLTFTVRPPSGTTINVNTTLVDPANQTQCTLRHAVQAANTNAAVAGCPAGSGVNRDVIVLPAGTYSVTQTLDFTDPKGATLRGASPTTTFVDGGNAVRIITTSNSSGLLRVESLALRNGSSMSGGSGAAIRTGNALTADNVHFLQNKALGEGGAIDASVNGPPITIINSVFTGNEADEGGAIETQSTLTVTGSTFNGNRARLQQGGAIEIGSGLLTITDSDFIDNLASTLEGGAIAKFGGNMSIQNSTFSGNSAPDDGGAIYHTTGTLTISGSTFNNNSGVNGGAIYQGGGTLQISNSTLHANNATTGGAIQATTAATTLRHVTITGTVSGGAIRANDATGSLTVSNSILANNSGGNCAGTGTRTSLGGNVQTDATCGLAVPSDALVGDALLGALQLNGGRTRTRLPASTSPAINAGVVAQCLAVDQRGISRPSGQSCDSGAVEVPPQAVIRRSQER